MIGKTPDGTHAVTAYFIMGRSANSRNRVFVLHDGDLFTEPFDPARVEDPSLIIYAALAAVRQLVSLLPTVIGPTPSGTGLPPENPSPRRWLPAPLSRIARTLPRASAAWSRLTTAIAPMR